MKTLYEVHHDATEFGTYVTARTFDRELAERVASNVNLNRMGPGPGRIHEVKIYETLEEFIADNPRLSWQ